MPAKKTDSKFNSHAALVSKIAIRDDLVYIVNTEEKGNNSTLACSRVYLKGKILFSEDVDFSHLIGADGFQQKLNDFLKQLHESVVANFNAIVEKKHRRKSEYLHEARNLLRQNRYREALKLLKDGLAVFPAEPLLLSYYGFLLSKAENNHWEGVRVCRDAISKLEGRATTDRERLYPIYYLNLGRVYLEANRKREAFRAFDIGLGYDPKNASITEEIRKSGKRRKPILPFLRRSNPLNKYLGKLISRVMKS
jgi:tetratricopeptide (TPR) repeat protein